MSHECNRDESSSKTQSVKKAATTTESVHVNKLWPATAKRSSNNVGAYRLCLRLLSPSREYRPRNVE